MTIQNTSAEQPQAPALRHFHPAAKAFHWLVAVLVFVVWPLGFFGTLAAPSEMSRIFFWHKALGFLLLWVMLVRLCVRFITQTPARPVGVRPWQNRLASANQWVLYIALIVQPFIGYLMETIHGKPFEWFGLLSVPSITGNRPAFAKALMQIHIYLAFIILALFVLHMGGVLFHRVIRRDDTLARMT